MALAAASNGGIGAVTGRTKQTVQHYTEPVRREADAIHAIEACEKMLLGRNQG